VFRGTCQRVTWESLEALGRLPVLISGRPRTRRHGDPGAIRGGGLRPQAGVRDILNKAVPSPASDL
jgi:hypothetical protein